MLEGDRDKFGQTSSRFARGSQLGWVALVFPVLEAATASLVGARIVDARLGELPADRLVAVCQFGDVEARGVLRSRRVLAAGSRMRGRTSCTSPAIPSFLIMRLVGWRRLRFREKLDRRIDQHNLVGRGPAARSIALGLEPKRGALDALHKVEIAGTLDRFCGLPLWLERDVRGRSHDPLPDPASIGLSAGGFHMGKRERQRDDRQKDLLGERTIAPDGLRPASLVRSRQAEFFRDMA